MADMPLLKEGKSKLMRKIQDKRNLFMSSRTENAMQLATFKETGNLLN